MDQDTQQQSSHRYSTLISTPSCTVRRGGMDQDTQQQSSHRYSTLTSTLSCTVRRGGMDQDTQQQSSYRYSTLTSTPSCTVRCVKNGPRYPTAELPQVQYPTIHTILHCQMCEEWTKIPNSRAPTGTVPYHPHHPALSDVWGMGQDTLQQSAHRYSTLTSTPSCTVRCVRNGPRYPTAELPQVQYPNIHTILHCQMCEEWTKMPNSRVPTGTVPYHPHHPALSDVWGMGQDAQQQSSHRYSTLPSTPSCTVRCVRNGPRCPTVECLSSFKYVQWTCVCTRTKKRDVFSSWMELPARSKRYTRYIVWPCSPETLRQHQHQR